MYSRLDDAKERAAISEIAQKNAFEMRVQGVIEAWTNAASRVPTHAAPQERLWYSIVHLDPAMMLDALAKGADASDVIPGAGVGATAFDALVGQLNIRCSTHHRVTRLEAAKRGGKEIPVDLGRARKCLQVLMERRPEDASKKLLVTAYLFLPLQIGIPFFVECGTVDVEQFGSGGMSLLDMAVRVSNPDAVDWLLAKRSDVFNRSPLHSLAGHPEFAPALETDVDRMANALVKAGFPLHQVDVGGSTVTL
jgi:hypothetical protein